MSKFSTTESLIENIPLVLPEDLTLAVASQEAYSTDIESLLSYLSVSEKSLINPGASEKRLREFALGRIAARNAIKQLVDNNKITVSAEINILRGNKNIPQWPDGVVGSISHCSNVAVAVVGSSTDYHAIGVDILNNRRITNPKILNLLCSDSERNDLIKDWRSDENSLRLQVFCAKESIYKLFSYLKVTSMKWEDYRLEYVIDTVGTFGSLFNVRFSESLLDKVSKKILKPVSPVMTVKMANSEDFLFSVIALKGP